MTPEIKENVYNFAQAAYFANATTRTGTVLERIRASYWRRTFVALTALQATTEVEYNKLASFLLPPTRPKSKQLE